MPNTDGFNLCLEISITVKLLNNHRNDCSSSFYGGYYYGGYTNAHDGQPWCKHVEQVYGFRNCFIEQHLNCRKSVKPQIDVMLIARLSPINYSAVRFNELLNLTCRFARCVDMCAKDFSEGHVELAN